jgi:uncharacterized membrane protein YfcA
MRIRLRDRRTLYISATGETLAAEMLLLLTLPRHGAVRRPTVIVTSLAAVIGSCLGARFTAGKVKSATLSRIFAVALNLLAAQRAWILLS